MQKQTFGSTGFEVTPLGFGGAPIGFIDEEISRTKQVLFNLLDAGCNLIDTASCYEGSEAMIGQTIGSRRDEYVLVSKCGQPAGEAVGEPFAPELITTSIDQSLRRLSTDVIDVMLLHSCDLETLQQGDALEAALKAKQAGKVKHVGYSGDNEAAAYAASLPEVDVIETSINLVDQRNIDVVIPVCVENNVGVLAKRPIANACWRTADQQRGPYGEYAQLYRDRFLAMNLSAADLGVDEQAWPELALRFTLSFKGMHTAIVGTTNPDNVNRNVAMVEKGPLPQDAVDAIRSAFAKAQSAAGEPWTGQT